jgi:tRNA(Ile)-lysidine synthase TilS/MesJ
MVDLSENEPKIASKFDLIITLLETFFSLTIDNSHEIMDMLKRNKESMMMALSKGLDSSLLLNKLKSIRLFKILSVNLYFSAEEVKAIMTVVRTEYRSHVAHQEFMGDVQSELKEICNFFPYETHECF